jgi:tungstate transport system substrate-binding protein
LITALLALSACGQSSRVLNLATTTSTADSGLLDEILPAFEEETNATVKVLAVGTGQAIALGERGDSDVILVHDRAREERFVADGWGTVRKDVMYNDFVIIGPVNDPAGISTAMTATQAFARIAEAGAKSKAVFVSRGDRSGSHSRELLIWQGVDFDPQGAWYRTTGQGMGDTLTVANELLAYTLSDRGTYLARQDRLDLKVLMEGDSLLFNPYGVIAVNPERHTRVRYDLAIAFIEYLTRYETQQRIGKFGVEKYGQSLFKPDSEEWKGGR